MAQVYIGTYGKYNSGNLAGAWIDLADCASYADFLAKCKTAHKDERDPEYMIQDAEGFPDGLGCMEWLTEADFNDVKTAMKEEAEEDTPAATFAVVDYSEKAIAVTGDTRPLADKLKALGGRFNPRLTCGPGWIFSKRQEAEVRALLSGGKATEGCATSSKKEEGAAYLQALAEWLEKEADDLERKNASRWYAAAVKLPEGYFIVGKPSIKNKFCFHDEGPDYELYKGLMSSEERLRRYFLRENLRELQEEIDLLKKEDEPMYVVCGEYRNSRVSIKGWRGIQYLWSGTTKREMTATERHEILAAMTFVRDAFEKRLQTYLKRYGTTKLHTWTYWADA